MKSTKKMITVLTLAAGLGATAFAQPPGGEQGQTRTRMDPAQMQQRMEERLKEELKASDDEWMVIQPLIAEVTELRGSAMRRGPGERGNRGNRATRDTAQEAPAIPADETAYAKASRELGEVLRDENASSEAIQAKLEILRSTRKANEVAIEAAREKLRSVVSVRQEAVLVSRNLLD